MSPWRSSRGYDTDVKRLGKHPDAQRLQTIPGIGPFGAALLIGEIGAITRFPTAHEFAAYAGLVPSTRSSGDKTAHGGVGRESNHWLKWILIEAVQTLKQVPGPVRFHYERLLRAKGKPKATVGGSADAGDLYLLDVATGAQLSAMARAGGEAGGVPDANAGVVRVACGIADKPIPWFAFARLPLQIWWHGKSSN